MRAAGGGQPGRKYSTCTTSYTGMTRLSSCRHNAVGYLGTPGLFWASSM